MSGWRSTLLLTFSSTLWLSQSFYSNDNNVLLTPRVNLNVTCGFRMMTLVSVGLLTVPRGSLLMQVVTADERGTGKHAAFLLCLLRT